MQLISAYARDVDSSAVAATYRNGYYLKRSLIARIWSTLISSLVLNETIKETRDEIKIY